MVYQAAEQGYPRAQQLLGECYENGYGVEQDEAKAAELYQLAHRAGYVPATCALGTCYEYGDGVEKDLDKAVELYCKAQFDYLGKGEQFRENYERLRDAMSMAAEYRGDADAG